MNKRELTEQERIAPLPKVAKLINGHKTEAFSLLIEKNNRLFTSASGTKKLKKDPHQKHATGIVVNRFVKRKTNSSERVACEAIFINTTVYAGSSSQLGRLNNLQNGFGDQILTELTGINSTQRPLISYVDENGDIQKERNFNRIGRTICKNDYSHIPILFKGKRNKNEPKLNQSIKQLFDRMLSVDPHVLNEWYDPNDTSIKCRPRFKIVEVASYVKSSQEWCNLVIKIVPRHAQPIEGLNEKRKDRCFKKMLCVNLHIKLNCLSQEIEHNKLYQDRIYDGLVAAIHAPIDNSEALAHLVNAFNGKAVHDHIQLYQGRYWFNAVDENGHTQRVYGCSPKEKDEFETIKTPERNVLQTKEGFVVVEDQTTFLTDSTLLLFSHHNAPPPGKSGPKFITHTPFIDNRLV